MQEWPLGVTDITAGLQNRAKDSSSKELVQLESQIEQISAERDSLVKQNADINEQSSQEQKQSGLRKSSGEPKEDRAIEGVPKHLLLGLSIEEIMQQQLEVINQAAQRKQKNYHNQ
jgi:hypothetical protein